jgi:ornithine decarboxylase
MTENPHILYWRCIAMLNPLPQEEYSFDMERYMTREQFEFLRDCGKKLETPFLLLDLRVIAKKYDALHRAMPNATVYYAVKSCPHDKVLQVLADRGSCFDVASRYELDQLLALGVTADRLSYGNTIKKAKDIAYAYEKGIRLYATDSESDLRKIAENAPGSKVFFRIHTDGSGADWPLSRKFGAHPDTIYNLILDAPALGVVPYGISFHVGSQQRDIGQWDHAIATCTYLFDAARTKGINLSLINLGGGFPASYLAPTHPDEVYIQEITRFLQEDFNGSMPEIILEPGRSLSGDAGMLVTEVVLISKKSEYNQYRWVYLDVGMFGGLIETMDEAIKYPIYTEKEGPASDVILAGPTCDSMDILYENEKYQLPEDLEEGDRLYFFSTGAYTSSYCAVNFNGFPPLKTYIVGEEVLEKKPE